MKHCQCTLSDLNIHFQDIFLLMGYKNNTPEKNVLSVIDKVYTEIDKICKPQYFYEVYNAGVFDNVSIEINNTKFKTGKIITHYLFGMEKCCVFTTTAGKEYETYMIELRKVGDNLKEFVADSLGSIIAEYCVNNIVKELTITDNNCSYPYSPGFCNWKLTEQQLLFSLLPETPCGIELTESCLMIPIKSTSGIIGIGKNIKQIEYACNICKIKNCYKRKKY